MQENWKFWIVWSLRSSKRTWKSPKLCCFSFRISADAQKGGGKEWTILNSFHGYNHDLCNNSLTSIMNVPLFLTRAQYGSQRNKSILKTNQAKTDVSSPSSPWNGPGNTCSTKQSKFFWTAVFTDAKLAKKKK